MKIYFAGAIRGGRAHQPKYSEIVEILKRQGSLISEHVSDETISKFGETDLEKKEIHERELKAIDSCDIMVAEVTTPSLGVGYEIAYAQSVNKPIICLYLGEDTYQLSAMIKGSDGVRVFTYQTAKDIEEILSRELK